MNRIFLLLFVIWVGCKGEQPGNPQLTIETKLGEIVIEVYPEKAPASVAAFLSYVDAGYYEDASFYRVLNITNQPSYSPKSELIQGGIWRTNSKRGANLSGIVHEPTSKTGLLHKDGTVSLARMDTGTATTEFFICIGDQPGFDFGGKNNTDGQGYAAFGKVVLGMDIVRKIYLRRDYDQLFDPPIPIYNIERR